MLDRVTIVEQASVMEFLLTQASRFYENLSLEQPNMKNCSSHFLPAYRSPTV